MKRIRNSHQGKSFEGIGISVPGRVDPKTQRLIFAPNLNWRDFDIKAAVERGMGLPVELENAAKRAYSPNYGLSRWTASATLCC